jgi:hypothetical protein
VGVRGTMRCAAGDGRGRPWRGGSTGLAFGGPSHGTLPYARAE